MITIYHNNRCSKSRSGLEILKNSGQEFEIINYLESVPDSAELKKTINLLNIKPIDLIRKNEAVWKEKYKGKTLSNTQIIDAMAKYPKLIERPIVIKGDKAVIGRPPELILDLIT
ncbi:arsenate reductase (glutaredoxin) [Lacinutrix sp. C3R15]|uniref:arsenate reductase (glutaredoxin) n=1 Tax=Flavobacteriaceae TaxID=49546 RepID=UPI001C08A820|nr:MULTISPECIES: arsenate reductase (glutaredoxin) [Flavobacteriaceae]MBU2938715.1 arsenate reductase (glutaredoxin) [Lacinutrix sp. C3R15]MDO6622028.1 arsenate reductase (glutaredoxin) [Oceanihabitans sp. 1_MG-2023]